MRPYRQILVLGLLLSLLTGGRAWAQTVTELYVTPDTIRIVSGQRQGLTVQAFDDAGNVILAVSYRSADPAIARVASDGTLTAGRAGTTQVIVQAGKKTKNVAVLVAGAAAAPSLTTHAGGTAPAEISQLMADPASLTLLPTESARVTLRALDADGRPAPRLRVRWRSLQAGIVTVDDSTGTITAVAPGQAVVQALVPGGPSLNLPVTVGLSGISLDRGEVLLSPGEIDTLRSLVPAQGRRLRSGDLQWMVTDSSVAQVTPDGVIQALTAGRTELVVQGFLQELRLPVIVHQAVARFVVAPRLTEPVRLAVQGSREFTLIPQTADSLPIDGVAISWTVGDTTIARFDPATGRLTAIRAGSTTLQFATRGFLPKGWTIEVIPGAIAFATTRLALRPGQRAGLAPQFVDATGTPVLPAAGLSWITSNANVAKVSADGVIEAMVPGRAVITAQAPGGAPSQATVFVTGDMLVGSTRGGRFGVYTLLASQPDFFFPVIADSSANYVQARYSPDRTRLAFSSDRVAAGGYDIYVADADGQNPVRVTTSPALDLSPVWAPDGEHLVFVSARSGVRQLYVMRPDGSEVRQLTSLPGGADEPAVSPDGKAVAFTGFPSGRDGQSDIFVVPMEGGALVAATNTPDRRETRPVYLGNGDLAWVLLRRDKREPDLVQRRPSTGGLPATLVTTDLTMVDLAVAGDGSRVAWVSSRPEVRNRNGLEFTFQWRSLTSGAETIVRLLPGERITSPAF